MIDSNIKKRERRLLHSLPWLVLIVLGVYAYAYLVLVPYAGIGYSSADGTVLAIYPDGLQSLHEEDRLQKVGEVSWQQYQQDLRQSLFVDTHVGEEIELLVERDGLSQQIIWIMPGPTQGEVIARLLNIWVLAFIFWGIGTSALLFIRASASHRLLFALFNYLTAIWLSAGTLSAHGLFASAIVLRIAIWLSLPVYWHLHWMFPRPLRNLPRVLVYGAYGGAVIIAVLQWFQLLPQDGYYYAFLATLAGSAGLMLGHMLFHREARGALRPIFVSTLIVFIPLFSLGTSKLFGTTTPLMLGALLAMPLLPTAYFYAFYHRTFRGFELRANRLISAYIFLILAATAILFATAEIFAAVQEPLQRILVVAGFTLAVAAIAPWVYPHFNALVERIVLYAPKPLDQLVPQYATRLAAVVDEKELVELLRKEILPAMQIRESGLLRFDEQGNPELIYLYGVSEGQVPAEKQLANWRAAMRVRCRVYWPKAAELEESWVRLAVPMFLGRTLLGLWLLGERQVDDYYAPHEVEALEAIAAQLALALAHIQQSEELMAFYQLAVQQREKERGQTARHLHDNVLQQIGSAMLHIEDASTLPPSLGEGVNTLRDVIYDLEAVSDFEDLGTAIQDLVDNLQIGDLEGRPIILSLEAADRRYGSKVEAQCYRIVEEALANALTHGDAGRVSISGGLYPRQIELVIRDDGKGFDVPPGIGVLPLLKAQHYGLATMKQRAAMIGGMLYIDSSDEGTIIRFYWRDPSA